MLFIIAITTFVAITLSVMGIYWLVARPQSAATERLRRMGQGAGQSAAASVSLTEERPVADFAERVAAPLSRLVPPSAAEAHKYLSKSNAVF